MVTESVENIKEWFSRKDFHCFDISFAESGKTTDGYSVKEGGNNAKALSELTHILSSLASGIYIIEAWKVGGAGSKTTKYVSITKGSNPDNQNISGFNASSETIALAVENAVLKQRLQYERQIESLKTELQDLKRSKKKSKSVSNAPDFKGLILTKLAESEIVQRKVADLLGDEKGQAFITNLTAMAFGANDDDDDDEDDDIEDDDEDDDNE